VALRTQQILAHESGVADTVDPLGGSYFVENLTNSIEEEASSYITKIDSIGGAVAALEQGFQQREIQESSYRYQKEVEAKQRTIVGVNEFVSPYPPIAEVKSTRDNEKVRAALSRLEETARGTDNTLPAILECVDAYASIGEICDVLRAVFGVQKEYLVV
jgi:methylmalonyl-CoA mutase N-terminal domain/subunit